MIEAVFVIKEEAALTIRHLKPNMRMSYILGKQESKHFENELVDMEEFAKPKHQRLREVLFSQASHYFEGIEKDVLHTYREELLWLVNKNSVHELYQILNHLNIEDWFKWIKNLVDKQTLSQEYLDVFERFLALVKIAKESNLELLFVIDANQ